MNLCRDLLIMCFKKGGRLVTIPQPPPPPIFNLLLLMSGKNG